VKDLIISRGKKIHAIDLEREIAAELRFLRKIAVVALPNEQVAVAAELRSLRLQNKEKTLRRIQEKVSRHVSIDLKHIYLVPAKTLPVTSSGKLQRYKIRQMVADGSLTKLSSYFVMRGLLAKWKENIFNFRFRDSSGWKADAVKEEIAFMFAKVAGIPQSQVRWDKNIVDYGLDSLKMMELLTELEKKIGEVPIFDFYQLHNLQQVYDLYRQRIYESPSP
jgi:aryl carrier-like protein